LFRIGVKGKRGVRREESGVRILDGRRTGIGAERMEALFRVRAASGFIAAEMLWGFVRIVAFHWARGYCALRN